MIDAHTLAARASIRECILTYCLNLDDRRWSNFDRVFHEGASCVSSAVSGEWRPWVEKVRVLLEAATELTQHQVGPSLIRVNGETALSETYVTASHLIRADAPPAPFLGGTGRRHNVMVGTRYIDTLALRDGRWRITLRRSLADWRQIRLLGVEWCRLQDSNL